MKKLLAIIALLSISFSTFANYSDQDLIDAANDLAQRKIISDKSANPSDYNL